MKKICLLSDTHGYMDQRILDHCKSCDEIWHAGDIGAADVSNQLNAVKLLRAIFMEQKNSGTEPAGPQQNRHPMLED